MDYRAFYDLVIEEKDYLQAFDVTQDYRQCKALAALFELQDYIANKIAEQVADGTLPPDLEG
jgi:hypothetical protein